MQACFSPWGFWTVCGECRVTRLHAFAGRHQDRSDLDLSWPQLLRRSRTPPKTANGRLSPRTSYLPPIHGAKLQSVPCEVIHLESHDWLRHHVNNDV